ncbi:S-adenosyl-L-methionine-dependent methyltransferase [Piedraia hortae CBS 480.64]|uniref:S-adenosyl-L-methionine-dependent methyltransferase n=1 Tax=Piedraia hortae CBS 480.64 TaxID=1314780 RepID=A0A6A7C9Y0_9PEZI|nr:S-adenosyl-L-methionine-dependent methyltransferase [Piedraia hortae CBS 480.64]
MPRGPKRGGSRGKGRSRGGGRQYVDTRKPYEAADKHNEKMERFYNTLNIVPKGEEREKFWAALRRELPNSFRFTGSKGHALSVRNNLVERYFPKIEKIEHEGKPVELPYPIIWYPENLAYAMTTPKQVVRKYEPFKEFQKFLVSETGVGNISRQEEVSMIPPLLLDVKAEHTVLDLCAAPGSKSAQLIEAIHAGEEEQVNKALQSAKHGVDTHEPEQGRSTGLLVANDVNYSRAQMLVHQVKRLNSPNLIVTNHDATLFPSIKLPSTKLGVTKVLKFDRILADVPCSGDGTCRKNPMIWTDWTPQNALGLYITQVRILVRALQLLAIGGRVVYSTCSMNPLEDEAVVSSAIERCGGVSKVRLVDCSDRLPGLTRSAGLTDWSVMNRDGRIYESWPEAQSNEAPNSRIVPGMFPPDAGEKIPLQNCMRVYPHQQDTGGFFISVLEKVETIRAKPEGECKCVNKNWTYEHPEEESTAFGKILNDVSTDEKDANGHLIQNGTATEEVEETNLQREEQTNLKRKAEETDAADAKRPKVDEPTNPPQDNNSTHPSELAPTTQPSGTDLVPSPFVAERSFRKGNAPAQEESFKYLPPTHSALEGIFSFYALHPSFPRDRFLVRNPAGDPVKGIYYTSALVKEILQTNAEGKGIKIIHSGVKMFMKQDVQGVVETCPWRIQSEGLPIIEGWVGDERVVTLTERKVLRKLLSEMFIRIGTREEPDEEGLKELGEVGEQARSLALGCAVLRVRLSGGHEGEVLVLPMWRSLKALNVMLPKEDRRAMLLRFFEEAEPELVNHAEEKQKKAGEANKVKSVEQNVGVEVEVEVDAEEQTGGGNEGTG